MRRAGHACVLFVRPQFTVLLVSAALRAFMDGCYHILRYRHRRGSQTRNGVCNAYPDREHTEERSVGQRERGGAFGETSIWSLDPCASFRTCIIYMCAEPHLLTVEMRGFAISFLSMMANFRKGWSRTSPVERAQPQCNRHGKSRVHIRRA